MVGTPQMRHGFRSDMSDLPRFECPIYADISNAGRYAKHRRAKRAMRPDATSAQGVPDVGVSFGSFPMWGFQRKLSRWSFARGKRFALDARD